MKSIDDNLINWAIEKIETKYKDDVALLIGQIGACKLPIDEQVMAFDYFVPATEKGYNLAQTFIIEDMGYDLYPMSFERLEGIADFKEPRMLWVLEKSKIIYAKNDEDKNRFLSIKDKMHTNLQNKDKCYKQALDFLNIAMEVYTTMQFEKNLCKVRKAAGGICSMLAYALAMINGLPGVDDCSNLVEQVNKMSKKPEEFSKLYLKLLDTKKVDENIICCHKIIQGVRDLMQNEQRIFQKFDKMINYEDLAFWYQEARYTFRKIKHYAELNDCAYCFSLGCYLQIEFDAIKEEFDLDEMDLLGSFDTNNLMVFQKKAHDLEAYIVKEVYDHQVELKKYDSFDDFIKNN